MRSSEVMARSIPRPSPPPGSEFVVAESLMQRVTAPSFATFAASREPFPIGFPFQSSPPVMKFTETDWRRADTPLLFAVRPQQIPGTTKRLSRSHTKGQSTARHLVTAIALG